MAQINAGGAKKLYIWNQNTLKHIYSHTTSIALHAVFSQIKQKQKFKNVVCALSQTEGYELSHIIFHQQHILDDDE